MTGASLDDLESVSLDELLAGARLMTRVDRKYVLTRAEARAVLGRLAPETRVLRIDGQEIFEYESLYFDTPDLLSYRMAAHARRRRFKVRTRSYVESGLTFLEVKTRGTREMTIKDRMEYAAFERLDEAGRGYASETLEPYGFGEQVGASLAPVLRTSYRRVTLAPNGVDQRVTIDSGLRWTGADGRTLRQPDLVVVETKTPGRPSDVDRLLWRLGHRPESISKYGTGLAALRGDLPHNKWARVLRRHFSTQASGELSCA